ncbi:MAG: 2-oxo acid dehydrogenase subunit E2 [Pseudomonadota bacterium]
MVPKLKELTLKKLSGRETGGFQQFTIRALRDFPDKYVSVMYALPAEPCKKLLKSLREKTGARITFSHALNKMIALAIAESPAHNQVLLDSRRYQLEGIHISNILLLPGEEKAMTNLILDNPHRKSLEQIARELEVLRAEKLKQYELKQQWFSAGAMLLMNFFYLSRLNRLISEKMFFKFTFQRGLFSNITLSNQVYGGRSGTFTVVRSITPVVSGVVIHTSGTEQRMCMENDTVISREILPLTVTYDHRVLHGIHAHHFGLSLERIASHPDKYLI